MNKNPLFLLLLCMVLENIAINQGPAITNAHDDSDDLQTKMNKLLYGVIKLDKSFKNITRIKLMYEMLNTLKLLSKNNYNIFKTIKTAVKVDSDINTLSKLLNLNQEIEEVMNVHIIKELNAMKDGNNTSIDIIDGFDPNDTTSYYNDTYSSSDFDDSPPSTVMPPTLYYLLRNMNWLNLEEIKNKFRLSLQNDIKNMNKMFAPKTKFVNKDIWFPSNTPESLQNDTRRRYHGSNRNIHIFSFLASIHIADVFLCAGTIIGKDLIITAASCLKGAKKNRATVRVGSDYTMRFGTVLPVIDIIFHPYYDILNLRNNLVVIRTKGMRMGDNVKWISIERSRGKHNEAKWVSILGWGVTGTKEYSELDKFTIIRLKYYKLDACKKAYNNNFVTKQNFCVGFVNTGSGTCNRDLGGPGVIDGVLAGVISFGPPICGMRDTPTVFTNIGYYAEWIDDILNQNNPGRNSVFVIPNKRSPKLNQNNYISDNAYAKKHQTFSSSTTQTSDLISNLWQQFMNLGAGLFDKKKVEMTPGFVRTKHKNNDNRNQKPTEISLHAYFMDTDTEAPFKKDVNAIENAELDNYATDNSGSYYDGLSIEEKNIFGRGTLSGEVKSFQANRPTYTTIAHSAQAAHREEYLTKKNTNVKLHHRFSLIGRNTNQDSDIKNTFVDQLAEAKDSLSGLRNKKCNIKQVPYYIPQRRMKESLVSVEFNEKNNSYYNQKMLDRTTYNQHQKKNFTVPVSTTEAYPFKQTVISWNTSFIGGTEVIRAENRTAELHEKLKSRESDKINFF